MVFLIVFEIYKNFHLPSTFLFLFLQALNFMFFAPNSIFFELKNFLPNSNFFFYNFQISAVKMVLRSLYLLLPSLSLTVLSTKCRSESSIKIFAIKELYKSELQKRKPKQNFLVLKNKNFTLFLSVLVFDK